MGAIIVGLSSFLGITIALQGMPIIGVVIGLIGGIFAGYTLANDSKY